MVRTVRSLVVLFRDVEALARDSELTLAQYRLLLLMREGPRRAVELAARTMVKKPSITPQIQQLEDRGLIRRDADPTDGRSSRLSLTEAGCQLMSRFEEQLAESVGALVGPDRAQWMARAFEWADPAPAPVAAPDAGACARRGPCAPDPCAAE